MRRRFTIATDTHSHRFTSTHVHKNTSTLHASQNAFDAHYSYTNTSNRTDCCISSNWKWNIGVRTDSTMWTCCGVAGCIECACCCCCCIAASIWRWINSTSESRNWGSFQNQNEGNQNKNSNGFYRRSSVHYAHTHTISSRAVTIDRIITFFFNENVNTPRTWWCHIRH